MRGGSSTLQASIAPVPLRTADLAVIGAYLAFALAAGIWASRRASRSGESYFLADRSLPGWLVGCSIVATTFAADTPLAVSGMVASKGIAANWFWWSVGAAHVGMFLFWSRLWRRASVVTDAELTELRYGGEAGKNLRSAKAVFFGLLYNLIVLGWVIRAMEKIVRPIAQWDALLPATAYDLLVAWWPQGTPLGPLDSALTTAALIGLATLYSTLGGLRGVVLTDLVQLILAFVGSFALAWYALGEVGGAGSLVGHLQEVLGPERAGDVLAFAPAPPDGLSFLSLQAFAVYVLIRWWAHPLGDGGGYIAQRLSAARSPRDARVAAGVFVGLHYIVRPWPWIVVGLVGLLVYQPGDGLASAQVADRELVYGAMAQLVLPTGMLGLLLASLLAAFMSTIDTHLNWGSSYFAHDLYRGRFRPNASERDVVRAARLASVAIAIGALLVTTQISSVEKAWEFVAALGSGLGLPVLLRWVWWRTNAEAEFLGACGSLLVTVTMLVLAPDDFPWEYQLGLAVFGGALWALWAIHEFGPSDEATLQAFYDRVQPPGFWGPYGGGEAQPWRMLSAWACAAVGLVGGIFLPGHLLLGSFGLAGVDVAVAVVGWGAALRLSQDATASRSARERA